MDLQDYPRPPNDTGIGVHWSAGHPAAVGMRDLHEIWLPRLHAMGVKWVKILHDGGVEFAQLLLQNDIMPIVRLYRLRPNSPDPSPGKGTLGEEEIAYIERYVSVGARYFEFNNEPDLHGEWEGAQVPANAEVMVARNAIIDMVTILERGGCPGIPATSIGGKWDLVGKIIELGRRDLFRGPVWIAAHNYDINHPLDYPHDAVNQQGQQLTREEYEELNRQTAWDGRTWGNRSLEWINEQRSQGVNPGHTIHDDASCWLRYARLDDLVQQYLSRPLPILATENGPIVGEDDDPRYPTTTPELHRDKVLEMSRIMMGTSEQFDPAPPQLFCTAFWLLGGVVLLGGWESHAWYSPSRPGGRLPVVDALKALHKQPRPDLAPIWEEGVIDGRVRNGAGRSILLDGPVSKATRASDDESFRFEQLRAGRYQLMVRGTELSEEARLTAAEPLCTMELELTNEHISPPRESILRGTVSGGEGYTLRLSGTVDRLATLSETETYRFADLPRGTYALTLEGTAIRESDITLDGREERVVDLVRLEEWTWEASDGGPGYGFGLVRCSVEGMLNLPVHLWTEGWPGIVRLTGSKSEYGPYACEFAPLGAGQYTVEPEGLDVQADINVNGSRIVWLEFRKQAPAPPSPSAAESVISGHVIGGASYALELTGASVSRREARIAGDGSYRFRRLPPGTYTLRLLRVVRHHVRPGESYEGTTAIEGQVREDVVLDGLSDVTCDFDVRRYDPLHGKSTVQGTLHDGAGQAVVLLWPGGYRNERAAGTDNSFIFDGLGSGAYELIVPGTRIAQTFHADGLNDVALELQMPSMDYGTIGGSIQNGAGRQIVLEWADGRQENMVTGDGTFRFSDLPAGEYALRVQGAPLTEGPIRLAAGEAVELLLDVPRPKTLAHCLLLGRVIDDQQTLLAAMRYATRFSPLVCDDVEKAGRAAHVTIIGGLEDISEADEQTLKAGGCEIHRIDTDIAGTLVSLVREGRAF
ncbi:MAG TPA: carboxypeptidase-like regulatory domain-containing protein [Anaerolineae bacterium]|nr:carboxypeptidase-like regulatory domain-containing protein [Anaerolineae bacterium]